MGSTKSLAGLDTISTISLFSETNTCMFNEESALSVPLIFTICVTVLFKEIATLTPTFASGGMTYCSALHGRS